MKVLSEKKKTDFDGKKNEELPYLEMKLKP